MRIPGFTLAAFAALFATSALLVPSAASAAVNFRPEIYAVVAMDAETGTVLHERDMTAERYPASLTKMMTLYLVFEALEDGRLTMNQRLRVSKRAADREPSKIGLSPGATIATRDAVMALITKSANDIATVVAEALGGTEANFAKMMTAKARALGMPHTTFRNASGLPARGHVSTALDMARLGRALIRDFPDRYAYFSTREFHYQGIRYDNQNAFLDSYSGADGIKTGYIRASGHNLAASAVRNGRRIVTVVLGGPTHTWTRLHTQDLFDVAFQTQARRATMLAKLSAERANPVAAPPTVAKAPKLSHTQAVLAANQAAGRANVQSALTADAERRRAAAPATGAAQPAGTEAPVRIDKVARLSSLRKGPRDPAQIAELAEAGELAVKAAQERERLAGGSELRFERAKDNSVQPIPSAKPAPRAERIAVVRAAADVVPGPRGAEASISADPYARGGARAPAAYADPHGGQPVGYLGEAPPSIDPLSGWSVQIGVFSDDAAAHQAAERALSRLPSRRFSAHVEVAPFSVGASDERLRARLVGMSESAAREACTLLHRNHTPCIVAPPGRDVYVATR